MDIRVLQYFLTVAREQNITKAAEALHITQPPLSRQLKELELELGTQLFIRGNKKLTLTDDGLLLKSRAEELVTLFEKTKAEVTHADEKIGGEIAVGCGETDAVSLIASAAKRLSEKYPDISYSVHSGDADRISERLDKGLIDFGLFIGNVDVESFDYLKLPAYDIWGVLMRSDDPLSAKELITAEDLYRKPLIVSRQSADNSEMRTWLREGSRRLNIVMRYDLLYNASHFVEQGFGYAIALDKIISSGERPLCFRPLEPELRAEIKLVWKKRQTLSAASRSFLNEMYKVAENSGT